MSFSSSYKKKNPSFSSFKRRKVRIEFYHVCGGWKGLLLEKFHNIFLYIKLHQMLQHPPKIRMIFFLGDTTLCKSQFVTYIKIIHQKRKKIKIMHTYHIITAINKNIKAPTYVIKREVLQNQLILKCVMQSIGAPI